MEKSTYPNHLAETGSHDGFAETQHTGPSAFFPVFSALDDVERSVILCTGDTFWIDGAWLSSQGALRPESLGPLTETLQNYEKELIEAALSKSKAKVAGANGAASKLGIPRSTLDLKIKQLNIKKHNFRQIPSLNSQNSSNSQESVTPISF